MDTEIEKRLKNLTPFAREQVDSTWLGGTTKRDWLAFGLLMETLMDLLDRLCDHGELERTYDIGVYADGTFCVIINGCPYDVIDGEHLFEGSTRVDALIDLINNVAARLEPTDQEKRDDAEVSAAC